MGKWYVFEWLNLATQDFSTKITKSSKNQVAAQLYYSTFKIKIINFWYNNKEKVRDEIKMLPVAIQPSFIRYLRLYTLHSVEQSATHRRILQVRIATLHYTLADIPGEFEMLWRNEPAQGVARARQLILPRLETLLNDETAWGKVMAEPPRWQPYLDLRRQRALPELPVLPRLSAAKNALAYRLDQAERWLQVTKTALDVANAGLALWQGWQKFRDERRLLQDAVRATLLGQNNALDHALERGFVPKYLAARGDDPVYPVLFEGDSVES
jgi:hypothetical protein